MDYPKLPNYWELANEIAMLSQLKHELGAQGTEPILAKVRAAMEAAKARLSDLPIDEAMAAQEPSDLPAIQALRPAGPRRLWTNLNREAYVERVRGALLGRFAACTLGAPVEFWDVRRMEALAEENGDPFPPTDYWRYVPAPKTLRYNLCPVESYTRDKMSGVPVDDDIMYTILALLIVERFGSGFSTLDVARAWLDYLPWTWDNYVWANLQAGISPTEAADWHNPKQQLINASIRADGWGCLAPGYPELAAELAWRDAYLSHRRNGIYTEMFFAASIAASFAVGDPVEALHIGLTEIPTNCALATHLHWALEKGAQMHDYRDARAAIDERFGCGNYGTMYEGMHSTHSINNACCTVLGILLGRHDFTPVIGETVAMGMDNDCTAATAGSIMGAARGLAGIAPHWYERFGDTVHSYLNGYPQFSISDLAQRFARAAEGCSAAPPR
jgi:ADP-ribosylglycohydrolase